MRNSRKAGIPACGNNTISFWLKRHRKGAAIKVTMLCLGPLCAYAQTPTADLTAATTAGDSSDVNSQSATLNAVVVTADRRREPAREVPMQLDTLSADALQQAGARGLNDYAWLNPGVDFQSIGGSGLGQLSIRGVTSGTDISPTVGVYVDDVAFGSSTFYGASSTLALDLGLLDLDRIEILRGPQGTLYGAGAMGGVLKYVSKEPDPGQLAGDAGAGLSFTDRGGINNTAHVLANVPIRSGVAVIRLSGFNNHDAGYVDAIGTQAGKGIDHGDTTGGRASLLVTPTRDFTLHFNAIVQNINRNGQNFVDYNLAGQPINGDLKRDLATQEPFHQTVQLYSAELEYALGWARLDAISSYQSIRSDFTMDASFYAPLFKALGPFDTVNIPSVIYTSKYSQELRLISSPSRTIEWLAGFYYTHEGTLLDQGLAGQSGSMDTALETIVNPTTYQEYAGYGDLTYYLSGDLSLTGGARLAHNHQAYAQSLSGPLAGMPTSTAATSSDTSTTYLGTIKYQITGTSDVYFRTASGYRPGGPNDQPIDPVTRMPVAGKPTFDPDKLNSYEIGYKGDFFQRRLSVESAVYDIYWKNIQQRGSVDGVNQVINAGDARIKGLELASSWLPTEHWNLGVSVALTDAQLKTGSPGVGTQSGNDLPTTPKFSAALTGQYLFTAFGYPSYAGGSERYIGKRQSSFETETSNPDFKLPAYAVTDLQSGIDFAHVKASLFVRNVFDRRGLMGAQTGNVSLGAPVQATVLQPRTIGFEANVPF